jgi:hypothetical protein
MKKILDEYLEFDSKLLFNRVPISEIKLNSYGIKVKRLVRVFGGAIRDIIAGQPINDIDILVGAQSCPLVEITLKENGYIYMASLGPKDLGNLYSEIHVINEPRTWVKGSKIVQLIRPVIKVQRDSDFRYYERGFIDLIQNVDISCCGVSWDGKTLYENYPNAIFHCQNKSYIVNPNAKMYSRKRADQRRFKLNDRGWTQIEDGVVVRREQRIDNLLSESPAIEYTSELADRVYGGSCKEEGITDQDIWGLFER